MSSKPPKEFEGIFFQTRRLNEEFDEMEVPIGSGSFGIVTKAKHKIDDKDYAIKKIRIKNKGELEKTVRERKMWAKLDVDFFVQYRSSWVELSDDRVLKQFMSQSQFRGESTKIEKQSKDQVYAILHIQMDLCSFSLREALLQLKEYFNITNRKHLLPAMGYYISSELLIEILVCIKYLHEFKPQILHRDINPNNILIKPSWNGTFVKIADFGGAVEHEINMSHTRMYGTFKYMAPEVTNSRKYDTSADVYSIGVMTQEMFNFDINLDVPMDDKYKSLRDITANAMVTQRVERPTCAKWLEAKSSWALDHKDVRQLIEDNIDVKQNYDINKEFVKFFLKIKFSQN